MAASCPESFEFRQALVDRVQLRIESGLVGRGEPGEGGTEQEFDPMGFDPFKFD